MDHEVVWDETLMVRLAAEYGIRFADCDPDVVIVDERSLVCAILGHARLRRGGERFVATPSVIEGFSARHRRTVTIGGTCVRAGLIMRQLGVRSTAVLTGVDDTFLSLFPEDCDYLVGDATAALTPHLIVQLPEEGRIRVVDGEILLDRPNRLIFVNDPPQVSMRLSADLGESLAGADVFLISGFNAMSDAAVLRDRIAELSAAMRSLPAGAMVVHEDAGYHSDEVSAVAHALLVPLVDVFSMNEDEMQAHLGQVVDLLDASAVSAALVRLHRMFPGPTLVVHTRHWALASGLRASLLEAALDSGIKAATARYLHGDSATAADFAALDESAVPTRHRDVAAAIAARGSGTVRCLPAYEVRTATPTTIGLGDSFVGGVLAELVLSAHRERRLQ
ncbi:MAG: hypothetical protein FWD85_09820 [Microbacteriaceae bacterium]|nr:hypothetical protein [Microbacteriaceae bacterium]